MYTGLKPSEVDLLVKTEFLSGFETYEMVGPKIFNIDVPDRLNEKESVVTTDGDLPQVAEGASYPASISRELGTVSYTSLEYKRKWGITALMNDFSNYGAVMKLMKKAGYRARYKQDSLMADVLKDGFTQTKTWDGKYLFSSNHKIGDTGRTQSNLESGEANETNITNAFVKLRTMKDHENLEMPLQAAYLVHPVALQPKVYELLKSKTGSETSDRKLNFLNTLNIVPIPWPLLDSYSTTAWFLLSDKMWHNLVTFQKVGATMKMYMDEDTDNMWEKCRFVQVQGATDYLGVVGSLGV